MRARAAVEFACAPEASATVRTADSPVDRAALRTRARAAAGLLVAFALASPASAAPERAVTDEVRGLWVDHREGDKQKVAVWIEDCDGLLCGRIHWLKKPLSGGKPKRDRKNPDAALRERPLCGLMILTGFRRAKENTWSSGHIYNPNDGRSFSSTMTLDQDGSLRIRGYIGLSLFGKTVQWVRPQAPLEPCG
jgi:uncharacterized protein (DUF2147 family)